jgi:hypothetical protein
MRSVRGPFFVTPHQIVAVAFRLFAIWLFLRALSWVPAFFGGSGSHTPYVYLAFLLALSAVIIFALWYFPLTIAGKLIPSRPAQSQPPTTPDTWLAIGCTLIGLWTLTTTIPQLVYSLFVLNVTSSYDDRSQLYQTLVYHGVQLAMAVWLVLGGNGVGKIFRWAQSAGIRKDL